MRTMPDALDHADRFTKVSPSEANARVSELLRTFLHARVRITKHASATFKGVGEHDYDPDYAPLANAMEEFGVLLLIVGWWAASDDASGISPHLRRMCEHTYLEGVAYKMALLGHSTMMPVVSHVRASREV